MAEIISGINTRVKSTTIQLFVARSIFCGGYGRTAASPTPGR